MLLFRTSIPVFIGSLVQATVSLIFDTLIEDPENNRHAMIAFAFVVHVLGRLFFYWSTFRIKEGDATIGGDAGGIRQHDMKEQPETINPLSTGFARSNSNQRDDAVPGGGRAISLRRSPSMISNTRSSYRASSTTRPSIARQYSRKADLLLDDDEDEDDDDHDNRDDADDMGDEGRVTDDNARVSSVADEESNRKSSLQLDRKISRIISERSFSVVDMQDNPMSNSSANTNTNTNTNTSTSTSIAPPDGNDDSTSTNINDQSCWTSIPAWAAKFTAWATEFTKDSQEFYGEVAAEISAFAWRNVMIGYIVIEYEEGGSGYAFSQWVIFLVVVIVGLYFLSFVQLHILKLPVKVNRYMLSYECSAGALPIASTLYEVVSLACGIAPSNGFLDSIRLSGSTNELFGTVGNNLATSGPTLGIQLAMAFGFLGLTCSAHLAVETYKGKSHRLKMMEKEKQLEEKNKQGVETILLGEFKDLDDRDNQRPRSVSRLAKNQQEKRAQTAKIQSKSGMHMCWSRVYTMLTDVKTYRKTLYRTRKAYETMFLEAQGYLVAVAFQSIWKRDYDHVVALNISVTLMFALFLTYMSPRWVVAGADVVQQMEGEKKREEIEEKIYQTHVRAVRAVGRKHEVGVVTAQLEMLAPPTNERYEEAPTDAGRFDDDPGEREGSIYIPGGENAAISTTTSADVLSSLPSLSMLNVLTGMPSVHEAQMAISYVLDLYNLESLRRTAVARTRLLIFCFQLLVGLEWEELVELCYESFTEHSVFDTTTLILLLFFTSLVAMLFGGVLTKWLCDLVGMEWFVLPGDQSIAASIRAERGQQALRRNRPYAIRQRLCAAEIASEFYNAQFGTL
jgi:hypothetical protein